MGTLQESGALIYCPQNGRHLVIRTTTKNSLTSGIINMCYIYVTALAVVFLLYILKT